MSVIVRPVELLRAGRESVEKSGCRGLPPSGFRTPPDFPKNSGFCDYRERIPDPEDFFILQYRVVVRHRARNRMLRRAVMEHPESRPWTAGHLTRVSSMIYRLPITAISLLVAAAAYGDVVLDQQHVFVSGAANSTNGNVNEVGQTFTVGVAGTLDHIDVLMFRLGGIFDPTADPVLNVYNTLGGVPDGAPLVSVSIPEALVPLGTAGFVSFDISAAAIAVDVNDVLAFGISTSSSIGPYFLLVDGDTGQPEDYAAGDAVARQINPPGPWAFLTPSQDHGFRTFVDSAAIPEPAGCACLWSISVGLACLKRRRTSA